MQRKNDSTILILVAAGLGIYWFMKNKSNTSQVNPADDTTGGGGGAYQQPEGPLVDYNPMNDGYSLYSPPNPSGGGGSMVFIEPVGGGRGGDTVITDMFNSINDYKLGINENYRYK
jgi:uncharacterized membrane protein